VRQKNIKMMKKILLYISAAFLVACNSNSGFVIEGVITGSEAKTVYLEKITGQSAIIDSFQIGENGKFKFVGTAETEGIYRLNFSNIRAIDLLVDNSSHIELTVDAKKSMDQYDVKGSEASLDIQNVNRILYNTYKTVETLQNEYAATQNLPEAESKAKSAEIESKYNETMNNQVTQIKDYINKSKVMLIDFYALSYLNIDENYDFINSVINEYKDKIPSTDYTKQYSDKFAEYANLSVGSVAPEIKMNDPEGKEIALSSLRGKVVLIDFWASWCGPCRKENPNNVKLYNEMKSKGFEIYGVSLDKNKEDWTNAIMEDKLTWTHVSDLKYWGSEAAAKYKVEAIPATYLIDKDGKILAKNLRGEELNSFVKKLLN